MTKCIFCETDLSPDTKPEHILLNALGGRRKSRGIVCSAHNEMFGGSIDRALTDQVPVIRNLLHLESGTGKLAPMLRSVAAGPELLNVHGTGELEVVGKPFTIEERPDGSYNMEIRVQSAEELTALIPHIARRLKISEDRALELIKGSQAKAIHKRPGMVLHPLSFGGPDVLRTLTKSCLELWATVVGNDEVKGEAYAAAREFVLQGDDAYVRNRAHLDSRPLPTADDLVRRFGEFFNFIYVRSDGAGRVVGHFTLYNMVAWQIVLAEHGGRPNTRVGLGSNPRAPADWSDKIGDELNIEFSWLDAPALDHAFARTRERMSSIVQTAQNAAMKEEIGHIVDDVCRRHGIRENDPITGIPAEREVIGEISHRIALHMLGIPFERPLTAAELESMLPAAKKPDG